MADILGHSSIDTTRIYMLSTGVEHKRKMEYMRLIMPGRFHDPVDDVAKTEVMVTQKIDFAAKKQ